LPVTDLPQEQAVALAASPLPETKANILLVDDNEPVRKAIGSFLRMSGYRVWQAGYPEEAIQMARKLSKEIDLVVTDVVMPQMSGRELAERLTADRPELKILFISGYTEQALVAQETLKAGTAFLPKPFPMQDLVRKIQDLLQM
jgi:two-component system cell cycle sensor histidine kinase/response regulator CckA